MTIHKRNRQLARLAHLRARRAAKEAATDVIESSADDLEGAHIRAFEGFQQTYAHEYRWAAGQGLPELQRLASGGKLRVDWPAYWARRQREGSHRLSAA